MLRKKGFVQKRIKMYINVLEQHLKNARLYRVFDENPDCEASVELYINLFNIQERWVES